MRLRCSNVGLLFSRRFASSSTRTTGGLVASNPPFRRIVNVAELFPSRTNGSPFAVGANAEIPAGMIVLFLFSFSMHLVNSTAHFQISMLADSSTPTDLFETGWIENGGNVEETSLWTMVAVLLRARNRASEFTDWTMSLESTDICRRRATHIFLLGGHSITLTTVNFAHA